MKRFEKVALIVVSAGGVLALASYLTTQYHWDGGFSRGEIRVNVRDSDGKPVQGAVLHVYRGGTQKQAFGYPLDNYLVDQPLGSDERGRITAIHKNNGLEFGGKGWELFWVIPMGDKPPKYDCEISAEGFKPLRFDVEKLYESPYKGKGYESHPKTTLTVGGKQIELIIYENTFTLER